MDKKMPEAEDQSCKPDGHRVSGLSRELSRTSINALVKMWGLIKPQDRIIQAVRLESGSYYPDRERYLAVIAMDADLSKNQGYAVIGIDRCPAAATTSKHKIMKATIGLARRLLWDAQISLDGDGGFSIRQTGHEGSQDDQFFFKPTSVQSLWTVIQTLHVIRNGMRPRVRVSLPTPTSHSTNFASAPLSQLVDSNLSDRYLVTSPQSCINEWHDQPDILVRRAPSPDRLSIGDQGTSVEEIIRIKLRDIMKSGDLDTMTSKGIRNQLEMEIQRDLEDYKSFIDKEMLVILGQMDPASKILDYLYLGSEWNASNLEELRQNRVTHVLNVTREIDSFFPALFTYKTVREYDEEGTDLLKYLNRTYKFIKQAKEKGGVVLVHCKMGISRSATVTISYIMKEFDMTLKESLEMVKQRRSIVKPNKSFMKQLEVYEGILKASRHRHTKFSLSLGAPGGLFRSRSEGSLEKKDPESEVKIPPRSSMKIKTLTNMFDQQDQKLLSAEPVSLEDRPSSWCTPRRGLNIPIKNPDDEDDDGNSLEEESCRCFKEIVDQKESSEAESSESSSNCEVPFFLASSLPEAKNDRLIALFSPKQYGSQGTRSSSSNLRPVNSPDFYDSSCPCDVEVEIRVPDERVSIVDRGEPLKNDGDEAIVHTLSDIPVRISAEERTQRCKTFPHSSHRRCKEETRDDQNENACPEHNILSSDRRKMSEELSVKTLASMFDFKITAAPFRHCSARLEDSHLFKKAKKQQLKEQSSDC